MLSVSYQIIDYVEQREETWVYFLLTSSFHPLLLPPLSLVYGPDSGTFYFRNEGGGGRGTVCWTVPHCLHL